MIGGGLEDIEIAALPFRREVAALAAAGVHTAGRFRRLEGRKRAQDVAAQRCLPVGLGKIERIGFQRLVGRRLDCFFFRRLVAELLARFVIVADQFQTRGFCLLRLIAQHDETARQVIKQRVEMVVEQRQPVFHADGLAAGADAFIQRIITRRAECCDVPRAEAADGLGVERRLAGGQQQYRVDRRFFRKLCFGVEAADGVQRRAEEVQAQRLVLPRWPKVHDAAAQGEVARLAHRAGAHIAVAGEKGDQRLAVHLAAILRGKAGGGDGGPGRHALERRIDGGDDDTGTLRIVGRPSCQMGKRREPAAFDVRLGRGAVVRQAVPGRERQHRHRRREE